MTDGQDQRQAQDQRDWLFCSHGMLPRNLQIANDPTIELSAREILSKSDSDGSFGDREAAKVPGKQGSAAVCVSSEWYFGKVTVAKSWGRFFAIGAHHERKNPARKIFTSGN